MAVIETLRHSQLVFAGAREAKGMPNVKELMRVREPVSRSKSGVQGKVADVFNGRSRHAESQNEIKAFRILTATSGADAWQEQPCVLEYRFDGKKHRYTPDLLVAWGSYQEVVEIKDDREVESPENQERFALISELLAEHGYRFRLWRSSEICAEPRLSNASLVLRYRCNHVEPVERERIRRTFSTASEIPLGALEHSLQISSIANVLRLVLERTLFIDWWHRLSLDSRVSNVPIGPRVWPCPPAL